MKILYIAYSCCPDSGSEDRIGWNVPLEASKEHEVYVITKEEHRDPITKYLNENPDINIRFEFVDIPSWLKKVAKGFLYSARLNVWHGNAFPIAKALCEKEGIQIIHQITPIEYRAIGNYGAINGIKFVFGPIGGGEYVPKGLWDYTKGHRSVEYLRLIINKYYKWKYKRNGRFASCNKIIFANKDTKDYLGLDGDVKTEVCSDNNAVTSVIKTLKHDKIVFVLAARVIYRKGHLFLFDAIKRTKTNKPYEVRIVGDGPDMKFLRKEVDNNKVLKEHVKFIGKVNYKEMSKQYQQANVFLMPSIRETGGAVLIEAMTYGLPVVTLNQFGGSLIVNNDNGWNIIGFTKDEYIKSLSDIMMFCLENEEVLRQKGKIFHSELINYTWEKKLEYFNSIYSKLV